MIAVARPPKPVKAASLFAGGAPVTFTVEKDALLLRLDPKAIDPIDTIVVLELAN